MRENMDQIPIMDKKNSNMQNSCTLLSWYIKKKFKIINDVSNLIPR